MAGLDLQGFSTGPLTSIWSITPYAHSRGGGESIESCRNRHRGQPFHKRYKALYGEFKWQATAPLTVTLNARYDDIQSGFRSYIPLTPAQVAEGRVMAGSKTFRVMSERAGLNYALSPIARSMANISTGFRVPTVSSCSAEPSPRPARWRPNPG